MIKEVDPNNDGKISYDEFIMLMKGEENRELMNLDVMDVNDIGVQPLA